MIANFFDHGANVKHQTFVIVIEKRCGVAVQRPNDLNTKNTRYAKLHENWTVFSSRVTVVFMYIHTITLGNDISGEHAKK